MSTSNRIAPFTEPVSERYPPLSSGASGSPPQPLLVNPDNPPWSLFAAVCTWIASVAFLFMMSLLFFLPFLVLNADALRAPHGDQNALQALVMDKTVIVMQLISTIPAHLLTLGVVWAVVTQFGKLPFWSSLGWGWGRNFGLWKSIGLALLLLITGTYLTKLLGGDETDLDRIVSSSTAARYATAFLATVTAPLVEEMVYRGVLYSALRKWVARLNAYRGALQAEKIGTLSAVVGVLLLFTLVHVYQYRQNLGVIAVIGVLSISLTVVRAYTGRLLPCYIIHLVFNAASSFVIIFGPATPQPTPGGTEQKAALILTLARTLHLLA